MASWTSKFANKNGGAAPRVGTMSGKPAVPATKPANRFSVLDDDETSRVPEKERAVTHSSRGRGGRVVTFVPPKPKSSVPDVKSCAEFPALGGSSAVRLKPTPTVSFSAIAEKAARLPTPPVSTKPVQTKLPDVPKTVPSGNLWDAPDWDDEEDIPEDDDIVEEAW